VRTREVERGREGREIKEGMDEARINGSEEGGLECTVVLCYKDEA
jgi:hypothetical protein